jgi:hypothetical protein
MKSSAFLASFASLVLAAVPADVSAGWVYSVPEGLNWWDQGILEWTDSSGFHNVVSNISRSGTSLTIGNNGSNPLCVNLDFSAGIEGDWQLTSIGGGTLGGSPVTNFVAPSTLMIINWGAFERNGTLRSVVLNEGLETINQNAFMACTALESFSGLPSTLTSMSGGIFSGDTRLPGEIVWPAGISKYDNTFPSTAISAFIATNGLKSIEGYAAFGGCTNLSKVLLGPDFEYAGRRAFGDNSSTKVDMHVFFNNFPSRGFDESLIDGAKNRAVTFHMEWSAKDEWNAWMETNGVFMIAAPETPYSKGELEHGTSWSDWRPRANLMWWHVPIASVGGTDYTSLRAAIDAADGAAITLLAPSVADFTDERVSLDKNEALVIVDAEDRVLGYEPGIPNAPGWKLAVSRQTRDGTPVIVYKAAGPATLILMK